jgi:predicted N-formylglutamate amidohydrolase
LTDFVLLTCEHGGNRIPAEFAALFRGKRDLLNSHRGYDPGALELARTCSRQLKAPLHFATVSRLLVELNRSDGHRSLFSAVTRPLPTETRELILHKYYVPYRERVQAEIDAARRPRRRVIHFSLHTFTPVLDGCTRRADVGLLYDPARRGEALLCDQLKKTLQLRRPDLIIRKNYPYLGISDGFVTLLRRKWPAEAYLGIEIEVNQRWYFGDRRQWGRLQRIMADAIADSLGAWQSPGPRVESA